VTSAFGGQRSNQLNWSTDAVWMSKKNRQPEQVATLIAETWKRVGALDILINNAGGQFVQPAIDVSLNGIAETQIFPTNYTDSGVRSIHFNALEGAKWLPVKKCSAQQLHGVDRVFRRKAVLN
jgi:NAD(P)-dependent dehydrogenase (short-subunit alcohol dehydrogenase family)